MSGKGNDAMSSGEVNTVRCTAYPCEQVKQSSNNWFIVWSDGAGAGNVAGGMFHCVDYSREMFQAIGSQARTVCGPGCAQKLYEKFLSGKAI